MNYPYKTEACVYFKTEGLSDNELNYTYNVLLDSEWLSLPHHGTFFKDDGETYYIKQASRNSYNSMTAVKHKDNPDIRDYRLVYEKDGCAVFRVPRKLNGLGCMVLLTHSVVVTGMDNACKSLYGNACGARPPLNTVFKESCKKALISS
ncbi:uncharacterized protein LOC119450740 [Dermacentor silvarum]|uniref:uncharacterized protein LOC119450740 n=1 Tax=Dermacentor silvarum TaxID=543639 RepID=UPI002100BFC2|nr:uncharacterized protein LOC119450740 [Dermacentor silvarum]